MKRIIWIAPSLTRAVTLLGLIVALPCVAPAQNPITVGTTDTTVRRIAPGTKFTAPVWLDMVDAGGSSIDAIAGSVAWNPAFLTLDSIAVGNFGPLGHKTPNNTAGTLDFDASSPSGVSASSVVGTLYFTAGQTAGGTRLGIMPTDASLTGTHVAAGRLLGWSQDICVAPSGLWGDADGSGQVNIIDAQQIAKSVVGDTLLDSATVANNGDANGDGVVDILDAQGIARFAVGLSAPARVNQDRGAIPPVATLAMNHETVTLAVGSTTGLLATPSDADGFTLVGCQSVSWSSSASDSTIVHVNPTGQITGLASGTATIIATWGSITAQSTVTVTP